MVTVNWENAFATGHVVAALSALLAGAVTLLLRKGTRTHRAVGAVYVVALVLVNVAALSLHRENAFGVFHALAVVSLVTLAVGIAPMLLGKRSPIVIANHAYCMTWSYAGLVAAGCGQLVAALGQEDSGTWVVPASIGTVLCISWVVIFGKVPSLLDRILADGTGGQDVLADEARDPHVLAPGRAPTPFTSDEIRLGCPAGRTIWLRIDVVGETPFQRVSWFVEWDKDGATLERSRLSLDGSPLGEPEADRVTWRELQAHASFAADGTTILSEQIETAIGELDCLRYTVREGATDEVFWFARDLPGVPIQCQTRTDGRVVMSISMVDHRIP